MVTRPVFSSGKTFMAGFVTTAMSATLAGSSAPAFCASSNALEYSTPARVGSYRAAISDADSARARAPALAASARACAVSAVSAFFSAVL